MILVKNINVIHIPDDKYVISEGLSSSSNLCEEGSLPTEKMQITQEMVQGRIFINAKKERFCIGLSAQVQEAIGLPMEAFVNMSNEIDNSRLTISNLKIRINYLEKMSFKERLKFLFTGKTNTGEKNATHN